MLSHTTVEAWHQAADIQMTYQVLMAEEYNQVWDKFYEQFHFVPNYYERSKPAILEPHPSQVFKFKATILDSELEELTFFFERAFREVTPLGRYMYALDWQHESYRFSPHEGWSDLPISIFPDGDYYIFLSEDFRYGTFGHPWQSSLCVFGKELIALVQTGRPCILEAAIRANP